MEPARVVEELWRRIQARDWDGVSALVAEDAAGKVSVTYNDPEYLRKRHDVPGELIKNLAGAGVVIGKAVE